MHKKIKCLFWSSLTNRYNSQLSFGCTHLRVHWGHARRHGKRSLEMLKGPIIRKKWIVITSFPGQYIDEALANHG